jgi:hypothetical protein
MLIYGLHPELDIKEIIFSNSFPTVDKSIDFVEFQLKEKYKSLEAFLESQNTKIRPPVTLVDSFLYP